jgi:hypothetical protein
VRSSSLDKSYKNRDRLDRKAILYSRTLYGFKWPCIHAQYLVKWRGSNNNGAISFTYIFHLQIVTMDKSQRINNPKSDTLSSELCPIVMLTVFRRSLLSPTFWLEDLCRCFFCMSGRILLPWIDCNFSTWYFTMHASELLKRWPAILHENSKCFRNLYKHTNTLKRGM